MFLLSAWYIYIYIYIFMYMNQGEDWRTEFIHWMIIYQSREESSIWFLLLRNLSINHYKQILCSRNTHHRNDLCKWMLPDFRLQGCCSCRLLDIPFVLSIYTNGSPAPIFLLMTGIWNLDGNLVSRISRVNGESTWCIMLSSEECGGLSTFCFILPNSASTLSSLAFTLPPHSWTGDGEPLSHRRFELSSPVLLHTDASPLCLSFRFGSWLVIVRESLCAFSSSPLAFPRWDSIIFPPTFPLPLLRVFPINLLSQELFLS